MLDFEDRVCEHWSLWMLELGHFRSSREWVCGFGVTGLVDCVSAPALTLALALALALALGACVQGWEG